MQHLDDALIAEWVDGAVSPDSPQHAAIAAHVDRCDECRARVDEERALAGHVRQLLGVAAPPERIPPFEEVLHRAGTVPRHAAQAHFPWRRLAWAATVVVAGGVGWYARGLMIDSGSRRDAGAAQVASRDASAAGGATIPQEMATQAAPPEEAQAVGGVATRQEAAPAPARGAMVDAREADAAVVDSVGTRVSGELAAAARRDVAPPAAPAAAAALPVAQAQASAENEIRMQKVAADVWMTVGRSDAERILGHTLLTVPNLPIAAIELAADTTTVRVRQDLGGGAALYLVQSRAAAPTGVVADAMAGAAAEPRERLARNAAPTVEGVVDGVRVVLSAPLSPDSLRVLLGRLR